MCNFFAAIIPTINFIVYLTEGFWPAIPDFGFEIESFLFSLDKMSSEPALKCLNFSYAVTRI